MTLAAAWKAAGLGALISSTAPAAPPGAASPPPPMVEPHSVAAPKRAVGTPAGSSSAIRLDLPELIRFSLDNPLVRAAEDNVEAMRAQLRKAKFAWIPIIDVEASITPGVKTTCQDIQLPQAQSADPFDFQYCFVPDENEDSININTIRGYFEQLGEAGVRFEIKANAVIPLTTFGKLIHTKRAAETVLTIRQLEKLRVTAETTLRVSQAFTTLALARDSLDILAEAEGILAEALRRVERDLGGSEDDWDDEPGEQINAARDPDDLYKTQLAEVEVAERIAEARRVEAVALAALRALAGRAAPPGFDVVRARQTAHVIDGGLADVEAYQRMALEHRPEAKLAAAAVTARKHQEKLARANFLPDLGILVRAGFAHSTQASTDMRELYYANGLNYSRLIALLVLRWRWDFHFRVFDLQSARAVARAAESERDAARLLLAQDVEAAYRDLTLAIERISLEERAVDLAWKLVISAQQKDTVGAGDAGELVKQLEKWYRKRFEHAEAIQRHNEALARLSRAVGTQLATF